MALIHIDPNTLQVKVSTEIDKPFVPDEDTIAIRIMAQQLREFRDKFIKEQYDPKVDQLMEMVVKYNAKFDEKSALQLKEIQAQKKKALEEQMKEKKKRPTNLVVSPEKATKKPKPKSKPKTSSRRKKKTTKR